MLHMGGRRRTGAAAAALLLVALAVAAAGAVPSTASSSGAWSKQPLGCYCHTGGADATVSARVDGFPEEYQPGQAYPLTVAVADAAGAPAGDGPLAGFHMQASAGTLSAPDGHAQVSPDGLQATHTLAGTHTLQWNVTWTAPPGDAGPVELDVLVNRVDGSRAPDGGDRWGRATLVANPPGGPPAPGGGTGGLDALPLLVPAVGLAGVPVGWAAGRVARGRPPRKGTT